MPPREITKDQLEEEWRVASKWAQQCRNDYLAACKEWGRTSSIAVGAWKRFTQADTERREAEKRWQTAT